MKTLLVASCAALIIAALVWTAFLVPRFQAAARALEEGTVLLHRRDYPEAASARAGRCPDRGPPRRWKTFARIGCDAPPDRPFRAGRAPPSTRRSPSICRISRQPPAAIGQGSRTELPYPLGIAPRTPRARRNTSPGSPATRAPPRRPPRAGRHSIKPPPSPRNRPAKGRRRAPRQSRTPRRSRGALRRQPHALLRAPDARRGFGLI